MRKISDKVMFGNEPLIDVAMRCAEVAHEFGRYGKYTEQGIQEDAFDLVYGFAKALGLNQFMKITQEEAREELNRKVFELLEFLDRHDLSADEREKKTYAPLRQVVNFRRMTMSDEVSND